MTMELNNDFAYRNPFQRIDLAEDLVRDNTMVDTIKGRYSEEVFNFPEVKKIVLEPHNHFIVGVPGSGKTMILGFLRAECLSSIYFNPGLRERFSNVIDELEKERTWGIYFGVRQNESLLYPKDFTGFDFSKMEWVEYYSDFVNTYFLNKICNHIGSPGSSDIKRWLKLTDNKINIIEEIIKDLTAKWGVPKGYRNLEGLRKWTSEKLERYHFSLKTRREFNIETQGPIFRSMGYPVIKLVQEFKDKNVIGVGQKVYFIIDEYDYCMESNKHKFAKAFNSFIGEAVRSAVPNLNIKIGTRPNAMKDLKTLENTGLKMGREFYSIKLDDVFRRRRKIYNELLRDIANKRLENENWFKKREKHGATKIKKILEDLKPSEEAEKYRRGQEGEYKHLRNIKKCCMGLHEHKLYENLRKRIIDSTKNILPQKFLSVIVCRKLRRLKIKKSGKPIYDLDKIIKEITSDLETYVRFFKDGEKNSKIYYTLKDMREPSLFQIASSYNRPKYYFGFDTIAYMSEGVPLYFLWLCKGIFDEFRYKIDDVPRKGPIKIGVYTQTKGIINTSSEIREQAEKELIYGMELVNLLDQLSFIFRYLLQHPRAHYPSPNSFSLPHKDQWLNAESSDGDIHRLKDVLNEAIDWGYLIKKTHRSKEAGSVKSRTKFNLFSILSAVYDISVPHLKEPLYLNENDLVGLMSGDNDKIKNVRKKLLKLDEYPEGSQKALSEYGEDN